jgi:hypothetical protein
MNHPAQFLTALAIALGCGGALAQVSASGCGELANAYGPFEYRQDRHHTADSMPYQQKINLVEHAHFTAQVEALISGVTGPLGAELDYTLRVFPNHHRALLAVMRLGLKTKSVQPPTLPRPVECYFERALRFQPDDTTARMLYATFLINGKRKPEAISQLERVRFDAGDNGFTHYNIGLMYLDADEPAQALVQAHRAMSLGFMRADLKDKLVALGRWRDPQQSDAPPASASAPAQ